MKLRLLNNSARIRLSQTEVSTLIAENKVSSKTEFPGNALNYEIVLSDIERDVRASFNEHLIVFTVAKNIAYEWANSNNAGIENTNQNNIHIIIEKDFQCLHKRPGENETDNFPNPLAEKTS